MRRVVLGDNQLPFSIRLSASALASARTLAEVRDAAGQSNVSITSGYLHITVDDYEDGALFC
jgi:hypothetical protein